MPYPPYVQTVTVTNACSAWYANLIWDVICSKRLTIIQRWKTGNTCLNQFALLSALLQFPPEFCGKKMYQQYKEYESATWATKNSEKRWAVFDRVYGLHCSWCKSSQMKLNRRQNETPKNVIPKLRLVYFHCSFFFASELPRFLKEKRQCFCCWSRIYKIHLRFLINF